MWWLYRQAQVVRPSARPQLLTHRRRDHKTAAAKALVWTACCTATLSFSQSQNKYIEKRQGERARASTPAAGAANYLHRGKHTAESRCSVSADWPGQVVGSWRPSCHFNSRQLSDKKKTNGRNVSFFLLDPLQHVGFLQFHHRLHRRHIFSQSRFIQATLLTLAG